MLCLRIALADTDQTSACLHLIQMTTAHTPKLQPECWLLADMPDGWPVVLQQALEATCQASPLAAWRYRYGLVRLVSDMSLPAALRAALNGGSPAVHVHSGLSKSGLQAQMLQAGVQSREHHRLEAHAWTSRPDGLDALVTTLRAELTRPDAWAEVAWRMTEGASFPVLRVEADPARADDSAREYRTAFKAWRKERLLQGDSGSSPFAEDDPLEEYEDEAAVAMDGDDDDEDDFPADDQRHATVADHLPPGFFGTVPDVPVRLPEGLRADGATGDSATWYDLLTWKGSARSADGSTGCAYTLRLQGQGLSANQEPWSGLRIAIDWAPADRSRAVTRRHRVCLMPHLRVPALVVIESHERHANVDAATVPLNEQTDWLRSLEGAPHMVVAMTQD